ncbi:unnamed protein product [Arabidopsis lyrata]|nr:unnamed protein product [Arabidopsis lyrata]
MINMGLVRNRNGTGDENYGCVDSTTHQRIVLIGEESFPMREIEKLRISRC